MNRKSEPAIWPYVFVLTGAFMCCVATPRSWQTRGERIATAPRAAVGHDLAKNRRPPRPAKTAQRQPASRFTAPTFAVERNRADPPTAEEHLTFMLPPPAPRPSDDAAPTETPIATSIADNLPLDPESAPDLPSAAPEASTAPEAVAGNGQLADRIGSEPVYARVIDRQPPSDAATADPPRGSSLVMKRQPIGRHRAPSRGRKLAKAAARRPHNLWGEPSVLLEQLDCLALECEVGAWATQAADVVRELQRCDELDSPRTALALKRLRDLVDTNHPLLALPRGAPHTGELRRLRYAVLRRLDLWELVPELAARRPSTAGHDQTVSLGSESAGKLQPSIHLAKLLADLERFEQTGLTDDGRDVAADVAQLASHDERLVARTRRWLEWNYRNSNLRLVLSRELLNRLVPVQPPVEEPVHDRILGIPTRGWSTSTARLSIRLIPDGQQIRFALEARGIVLARTASRRDPVTVYSNSDSAYLARKQFQLSAAGLQTWPAQAEVTNNSHLRGIETDYDDVPFLGPLVEGIARAKHAETEPAVRRVARRKVASRVQEEVDAAIEPKLAKVKQLYQERVIAPLEGLSLTPTVIELQTTDLRSTTRLRMAGDEQLAASTPRPMALARSLASLQLHQSLVNNVCDRLDLDGHSFTLAELRERLVEAFKLKSGALDDDSPSDLRVTFAKRDAVIVRFDEGRVEVTLGVEELRKYPKTWRDFQVRVYYRPRTNGLDLRFVRDGTVQLRGEHFGHEPQIALRGIFSKVFSHDRELVLVDSAVLADPRLAGLGITQCVLTDGWLGLSLGEVPLRQALRVVGPLY